MRLLLVLLGVMTACPLWAAEPVKTCDLLSTISRAVMSARQASVAMPDVMEATEQNKVNGALGDWVDDIVIDAYEQPAYSSPEYQAKATNEFVSRWHLKCVKATR